MQAVVAAAVATPAPGRVPSAARQSLSLGGPSGSALSGQRAGAALLGGGSGNNHPVANTPLPNAPKRTAGLVPSRANFQLPEVPEMGDADFGPAAGPAPVGLLPVGTPPQKDPFKDPRFVPAGDGTEKKPLGTLGMVLASLLLGSLAFLAFKLLTGNGAGPTP